MKKSLLFLTLISTFISQNVNSSGVDFTPGLIPLEYGQRPATDLIFNGSLLTPDEAHQMVLQSNGTFDLSKLDPDETSMLWKNQFPQKLDPREDQLEINENEPIYYQGQVPSRATRIRFNVSQTGGDGIQRNFILMASKEAHNILLNKNLLRKLGYRIPPIQFLKMVKIKFSNTSSKREFFSDLSAATLGDPSRWVPSYEEHLTAQERIKDEEQREKYESFLTVEKKQLVNSGECLSRDLDRGTKMAVAGKCDTFLGSNWIIEDKGYHFISIKSPFSGKCLEVSGASKLNKARVREHDCHYKNNQIFEKIPAGNSFLLKAQHSGKCLTFRGGLILKNRLVQKDCEFNNEEQKWSLKEMIPFDGKFVDSSDTEFQDVIAMPSQDFYYNLAMGFLPEETIKGRRILNSLLIPFSLVNVPESVNLFNWHIGRIINKQLNLDYGSAQNFNPSYEDAKWIGRRILKLTRKDFEEIVEKSFFPKEVQLILVEKLLARRNNLKTLLGLEGGDIEFNPDISFGEFLKKGKLLKENFPGYASRYSFGDPESPLNGTQVGNFIGSTIVSKVMSGALEYLGSKYLNNQGFMLEPAFAERQKELFLKMFEQFTQTGTPGKIPFGIWAYPTFGGSLIFSRDVVIGNYLGTDNKVQLVDTVGFAVNAGVFVNVEGLAGPIPTNLNGNAQLAYARTFAHLKPISSFKAAFKYPFRNIIVPYLQRKVGREFLNILTSGNVHNLPEEERRTVLASTMEKFKKELAIGESLIISDNLILGANLNFGTGFFDLIKLSAGIGASNITLNRLHIYRLDEDTIHVYRDIGNVSTFILSFSFRAVAPVLDLSIRPSAGFAKTKFYSIDINNKNPNILENIQALRGIFRNSSLEVLDKIQKPYILRHKFKETLVEFGLTAFQISNLSGTDQVEIHHPSGAEKTYFVTNKIFRRGINVEQFIVDTINGVLGQFTRTGLNLSNLSNGSPADSILGSSFLYGSSFEGELENPTHDGLRKKGELSTPFGSITKSFRGFVISKKKAQEIINNLNEKYGMEFYPSLALQQTKNIYLYDINLHIFVYETGIDYLTSLSEDEFYAILEKEGNTTGHAKALKRFQMRRLFISLKRHLEQGHYETYSKKIRDLLTFCDRYLSLSGFKEVLGGDSNFFVISKITGFRNEDEAGDTSLFSNSIGQFGSEKVQGPLASLMDQLGMTYSEFYAYWIRSRVN